MKFYFVMFLAFLALNTFGQNKTVQTMKGKVIFVTAENIYVNFDNMDVVHPGNMLQLEGKNTPCLIVKQKSSSACVCTAIGSCKVKKGDIVLATITNAPASLPPDTLVPAENAALDSLMNGMFGNGEQGFVKKKRKLFQKRELTEEEKALYKESIKGRISFATSSNIASKRENRHRLMSRFSLNADHIRNSKFSFESYANYSQIFPTITKANGIERQTRFFRVYNLALRYEAKPDLKFVLGRKINSKISSLGAIDGLQVEKNMGANYLGIIVGTKPDITAYNFNPNLLEYGGYLGRKVNVKNFYSQSTVGFIEQRNNGRIDRRYTYFQHSSTILKKLFLFTSLEMDVFGGADSLSNQQIRIPNLYASVRYKFNRKWNLSLSYDSRKRIIYYETFQTEIERMLNDDIARQGIRVRLNTRPIKYVSANISYSKRFQTDNENKSKNINMSAIFSKIPSLGGRFSVTYNMNSSNYLKSNILSTRYSRPFIDNKLDAQVYYRLANYTFQNSENARRQHYYGTNLSYYITRKLMLSLSGELASFSDERNYRVFFQIVKRFYSKNK